MTTEATEDLEEWFTNLFTQITKAELQTLIVAKRSYIGGLNEETKAEITARLAPHRARLAFVNVLALRMRVKATAKLADMYQTLSTREGQVWLGNEIAEIRALVRG